METEFSALASRIAASSDVLGCLILSADGVVLGTFPPVEDGRVKPAWLKFAALGAPQRGFIQMSAQELWAYVSSGPYAAFAVATGDTRPGVLLDHLEQALLFATEARERREVVRPKEHVDLSDTQPLRPVAVGTFTAEVPVAAPVAAAGVWRDMTTHSTVGAPAPGGGSEPSQGGMDEAATPAAAAPPPPPNPAFDQDAEVDRVSLAREFAGLLQDDWHGVEDS